MTSTILHARRMVIAAMAAAAWWPCAAHSAPPKAAPRPAPRPEAKAADALQLDPTAITGQKGLPRVLYIVPWKRAGADDAASGPDGSLLDEVLAPVDRTEFRRQQRYAQGLEERESPPAKDARP